MAEEGDITTTPSGCSQFLSFFKLSSDYRKAIWLKHSRNKNNTKHIFICENHFYDRNISVSGIRKTLIGDAFPKPVDNTICDCTELVIDNTCKMLLDEKKITNKPKSKPKRTLVPSITDEVIISSEASDGTLLEATLLLHPHYSYTFPI